jgi:hypothetical protein
MKRTEILSICGLLFPMKQLIIVIASSKESWYVYSKVASGSASFLQRSLPGL